MLAHQQGGQVQKAPSYPMDLVLGHTEPHKRVFLEPWMIFLFLEFCRWDFSYDDGYS